MDLSRQSLAPQATTTHQWRRPQHLHRAVPAADPLPQICPSCFDLDEASAAEQQHLNSDIRVDHVSFVVIVGRTLASLRNTASLGCQSCALLLKVMRFFGLDLEAVGETRNIYVRLPIGPGNVEVSFIAYGSEVHAQLYTSFSEGRTWKRVRPLKDIATDHLSEDSLIFVNACLRSCLENHGFCRQIGGSLPARLLDIGTRDDGRIRLIETIEYTGSPEYTALSYCWGDSVTTMTTRASLEQMKAGIEVSELPQTYIDAVLFTRELGLQYLWIDSLCVIQDSFADWERESSIMGGIYSGARLTIAASSTTAAVQPFLRRGAPAGSPASQEQQEIFSERIYDNGNSVLVNARLIPESGVHWKWQDNSDPRSVPEPLSRRGWTLQERLLSTRLLSISETELQWTCQQTVICECRSRLNYRREFGLTPLRQITQASVAFNFWHKVIENYTKRSLSQRQDRLPAISAVAAVIQEKTGSNYVAGLWMDNIHLDLLWRRCSPIKGPPQSEVIAPSFSWASIDGEVDYYCFRNGQEPFRTSSSIVEIEIAPSPHAPLGRVGGGSLTMFGSLIPGFVEKSFADGWMVVRLGEVRLELYSDTNLQEFVTQAVDGSWQKFACRWNPRNHSRELGASTPDTLGSGHHAQPIQAVGHNDHPTRCWAIRIGSFQSQYVPPTSHELLILGKPLTNPEAFERIGLASLEGVDEELLFQPESLSTITIV